MSIWQTSSWSKMLMKSGQAQYVYEIENTYIEKRSIGFGEYGLFVIGLENFHEIKDSEEKMQKLGKVEDKLMNLCQSENCLFAQIENLDYSGKAESLFLGVRYKAGSFKKFIVPYTAVIDLSKKEDDILKDMKQKGRYNIKVAEKNGIKVESVEKNDENIETFYMLLSETTKRGCFNGNNLEFYRVFMKHIDISELIFAYKNDTVVAAAIVIFDKEVTTYYYGASTSTFEYRSMMAAYALQWYAIQRAKKMGSKLYDFMGVTGPGGENPEFSGVTDFKTKFTTDIRKVSESFIRINKPFKYKVIMFLKAMKKLFKQTFCKR